MTIKLRKCIFFHSTLSNEDFSSGYENIIQLIEIYAALACSNAEVERGFSTMNRIKTDIRNLIL